MAQSPEFPKSTHYQVLGISRYANAEEIKSAYKTLAKKYHPDLHGGALFYQEHFKKINEAHAILSDPSKRSRYDALLYRQEHPELVVPKKKKPRPPFPPPYAAAPPPTIPFFEELKKNSKVYLGIIGFFVVIFVGAYFINETMNKRSAETFANKGEQFEKAGNTIAAFKYYHEAVGFDKENVKALRGYAWTYFNLTGKATSSLVYMRSAFLRADSVQRLTILPQWMAILHAAEEWKELELVSQNRQAALPDSLFRWRVDALVQLGQTSTAFSELHRYLEANPNDRSFDENAGLLGYNANEFEKAQPYLNQALAADSTNRRLWYISGMNHRYLKDTISACECLRKAAKLDHAEAKRVYDSFCP
jgi:curved DNA-binding protein CbpA